MRMNDKVFEIYPDNVAAEQIIHTKHVKALTPEGFREACMLDIDTDFMKMERGKLWLPAGILAVIPAENGLLHP